ncbi:MAG: hypothetical protein JNL80_14080 [Phycisphaerae bacterium]|jgi:hypothetical protein|nr:hypothetical protein [Phycisphaerae bacterium]
MLTASLLAFALLLGSPSSIQTGDTSAAPPKAKSAEVLPDSLFVSEKPKDAKQLKDLKASAVKGDVKKGDTVTVQGRVGGRKEPFIKSRAMFLLADLRIVACNEKPDDACPTPWDFCCETPESLKANTATIQVVGGDGKVLKVDAQGSHGLKPLAKLVIVGTVSDVSKEGAFVITATKIFVEGTNKEETTPATKEAAPAKPSEPTKPEGGSKR